MLLNIDRDKNIDFLGKKCLFSVGHILLSDTEFKGEGPAPSGSGPPLVTTSPARVVCGGWPGWAILYINRKLLTVAKRRST